MLLSESNRVERIATLTRLLVVKREVNTVEAAELMTVEPRLIQRDLREISRVLPIYCEDGYWRYLDPVDRISPY